MWKYLAIAAVAYWCGHRAGASSSPADGWLDDLLLRGYAADQVADLSGLPAPAQTAAASVASATTIPRGWLAVLIAKGAALDALPRLAQMMIDKIRALGRPEVSDAATLRAYRTAALDTALAAL